MYKDEPIFLKPSFQERIWGGNKLNTEFNYGVPFEKTGEAWVISAHPNGPSTIANGPLSGKTLIDAWNEYGELFNKDEILTEEYPLLVKILDAADDLSVQVHPNDSFAREVEGQPYGKTECWYVLSAEEGSELILGHDAATKEELQVLIDNGNWNDLLRTVTVNAGDFVYVPSGTIHAIGKGIVILETQQSSDITYRVYDYERTDSNGAKRDLHLERSIQVTTVPHEEAKIDHSESRIEDLVQKKLVEEEYFSVFHWKLNGKSTYELSRNFLQVSVILGEAQLIIDGKSYDLSKGDHFLLPHKIGECDLVGNAEFVVSHT